jgi:hypothetical protein
MMRNGRNNKNPISKARLSSEIMKAGTRAHRQIVRLLRLRFARHVDEQPQVLLADVLLHETTQRAAGAVEGALRSSESTTTMRVNEVIITRIDGASDSTAIN